jgi:hypothetical protein
MPSPLRAALGAGIGHEGARALVEACRAAGLKTAVASSADRVKVSCTVLYGTVLCCAALPSACCLFTAHCVP